MGYKTLISLHREKTRELLVREGCSGVSLSQFHDREV